MSEVTPDTHLRGQTGLLLLRNYDRHQLSLMGYSLDERTSRDPNSVSDFHGTIYVSLSQSEETFIQNIKIVLDDGRTFRNHHPYKFYTSKCLVLLRRTTH